MELNQKIYFTPNRPVISDLDQLPFVNRSLVDYETYTRYIGQSMVKNCISLQATRGCPYNCAFCHKIWPKKHIVRSAENIFAEIKMYYDLGIRRFVFVDDIFNFNKENSTRFFRLILKNKLKVQLLYPNGLRCDLLTKDYMDLMVEAGTIDISFALDTASPRLQKLINKNLHIERFRENIEYMCKVHPGIILDLQVIIGFPTETEEEATMSLDFVKSLKWLDFPYIHILKIFHGTDIEKLALKYGISRKAIERSQSLSFNELPKNEEDTLPFSRSFTYWLQTEFLHNYLLLKERLLHVLPLEMKVLTQNEIIQKYNSYFPYEINTLEDLLHHTGITREELGQEPLDDDLYQVPDLNKKIADCFPGQKPDADSLKVLLIDLTLFFSTGRDLLYNTIEPPLGLMFLMSYLQQQKSNINGKIVKSKIDFNSYEELKLLLDQFEPDVIGIRTLSIFKKFFHETVKMIRHWGINVPLVAGGPYATSDCQSILKDANVDIVVLGEGEKTFCHIIDKIKENSGKLPEVNVLKEIPGIAFVPSMIPERSSQKRKEERLSEFNDNLEDDD